LPIPSFGGRTVRIKLERILSTRPEYMPAGADGEGVGGFPSWGVRVRAKIGAGKCKGIG